MKHKFFSLLAYRPETINPKKHWIRDTVYSFRVYTYQYVLPKSLLTNIAAPIIHIPTDPPRRRRPSTQLSRPPTAVRRASAKHFVRLLSPLYPLHHLSNCMIRRRHLWIMRRSTTMPATRHHEQIQPVADIFAGSRSADLLQMLNGPGRCVERIGPALGDEHFAAVVLEGAEVWVDGVDEGSGSCVEVVDIRGPVECGGVVGEVVVD